MLHFEGCNRPLSVASSSAVVYMMMWACARLPVDRSRAISAHPLFLLRWAPSPPPTHHPNAQPQAAHRTEQNMSNGENVKTEGGAAGDHIVIRGTLVS